MLVVAVEAAVLVADLEEAVGDLEEAVGDLEADLEEEVVVEGGEVSVFGKLQEIYMLSLLR